METPWDIDAYLKVGGYEAWKKCVKELTPEQVVQELKNVRSSWAWGGGVSHRREVGQGPESSGQGALLCL